MLDVSRWLAEQGLGHHAEVFAKNGIAGDVLRELTDADLKELGLNLGDRKRLLKAIVTRALVRSARRPVPIRPGHEVDQPSSKPMLQTAYTGMTVRSRASTMP